MILRFANRMLREPAPPILARFLWNLGWKGGRAIRRFRRVGAAGGGFPPFLFISVTNRCNLACQGCWVSPTEPPCDLGLDALDRIVADSNRLGTFVFGILGGEPLLHDGLLDLFARHRDSYFILFTNGTLLTPETTAAFRRVGNVTPLVSVEGREAVSDERRGGSDVYARTLRGLAACREQRLITGVATSLCRSNLAELAAPEFIDDLVRLGVHYLWYYLYRPVGPRPCLELALSADEILRFRRFLVDIRTRAPLLIVDSYWDAEGRPFCPSAAGLSYHIGPAGDVEPCPPIQFARDRVDGEGGVGGAVQNSEFLRRFREFAGAATRGCVLMESPEKLRDFLAKEQARDTSGRGTAMAELAAMRACPSHAAPGVEVPERTWFYRAAKRAWFFGMGTYG